MQISIKTRKGWIPPGIPRINTAHPLATGLYAAYVPSAFYRHGTQYDLLGRYPLVCSSHGYGMIQEGGAIDFSTSTAGSAIIPCPSVLQVQNASIFWRGMVVGTPTQFTTFAGITFGGGSSPFYAYALAFNGGLQVELRGNTGGSETNAFGNSMTLNTLNSVGGTVSASGGSGQLLYQNGVQTASNGLAGAITYGGGTGLSGPLLALAESSAQPVKTLCAFFWNRTLSSIDMALLHEDPYQFLIFPQDDMMAFLTTTATITSNSVYRKTRSSIGTRIGTRQRG